MRFIKKGIQIKKMFYVLATALFLFISTNVYAIPELQIYIENSSYDTGSQTWVTTSPHFTLWVLGDVSKKGTISDVMLCAAYKTSEIGTGSGIALTPTTATGITDPSTPGIPAISTTGSDTAPLTGDGTPLPDHGIYIPGISWTTYSLGDFSFTDSPIGDYITSVPITFPDTGQINAYDVDVSGYSWVHFDAFDHVVGNPHTKYVFAPFSHDGGHTPEPATLSLLGLGLAGLLGLRKKRVG